MTAHSGVERTQVRTQVSDAFEASDTYDDL